MDPKVLVQIRFLCKSLNAARHGALVGSLPRVDPQMVEKVVPLSEEQIAALKVAL